MLSPRILKTQFWTKKRKDRFFIIAMLSLAIAHFLVFWLYVNFNSILMAFQTEVLVEETEETVVIWSLEGFRNFFSNLASGSDSQILIAIRNTLIAFAVNCFITFPITILCCYILYKKVPGYKIFRVIFFLPSIVSGLVLVMMFTTSLEADGPIHFWIWQKLLGNGARDVNYWFYNFINKENAFVYIQIFDIWSTIGIGIITMTGALYRIPKTIFESSKLDGAGMWTEFRRVVLPLMWPTLSTYLIYKIAGIFLYSGPILLFDQMVSNRQLWTLGYYIFSQVKFENNYYYAASVGMVFTIIGLPIILTVKHFLMKHSENISY